MNSFIYLTIIGCVSVTGDALTCIKSSSSDYSHPTAPTEQCQSEPFACVLRVTTCSSGTVTTRRRCANALDGSIINRFGDSKRMVKSINTFFCTTDMCNQTPPNNSCSGTLPAASTNHTAANQAQLVSLNFITFAFTLCTFFYAIKTIY